MEFPFDLSTFNTAEIVIIAIAGLALLFFGYRIKKVAFFIMWFILGFYGTTLLIPQLNQIIPEVISNELYRNLLPIGGGLLLALLGFSIEKFCIAGICFVFAILVAVHFFGVDLQVLAIGAVVGVILGAFAVMIMKPAVIIITSLIGAYAIMIALAVLIPDLNQYKQFFLPAQIVEAAVGAFCQFLTTKKLK